MDTPFAARSKQGETACLFPSCGRASHTRGYCQAHYAQVYRGQELRPILRGVRLTCLISDCAAPYSYAGACDKHGQRMGKYGLSVIQLDMIFRAAVCDACGESIASEAAHHIDHDHSCCLSGKTCGSCIRGILCSGCNTAIGLLGESPARITAVAAYVMAGVPGAAIARTTMHSNLN